MASGRRKYFEKCSELTTSKYRCKITDNFSKISQEEIVIDRKSSLKKFDYEPYNN